MDEYLICESHGSGALATCLIYFNDGGPTFAVCDPCAEGHVERGASRFDFDDPTAPVQLEEWMRP